MTSSTYPNDVQGYLEQNLPGYLDILRQMVEINSFTGNAQGVNKLGRLTAETFAELGFEAERVRSENPLYGDHLVLVKEPESEPQGPTIGLVSHLDTVFPPDEERRNNFAWRTEGRRIYGPGTVDIKGGTVVIFMVLSALRALAPEIYGSIRWRILMNAAEEVLTPDFGQLCQERLDQDTLACLVFEGGRIRKGRFSLVTARKGMATFRLSVVGKAAHAGTAHKHGANAIVQLAHTLTQIAELTDYRRGITFNVGTVAGGTVLNRVPHLAVASGEMRAFSKDVFEDGLARLTALRDRVNVRSQNGSYPCRIDVDILNRWGPWVPNSATHQLFELYRETAVSMGMDALEEERGGLSDGNFLWNHVPTIDGLGPSGGNAHCSERSSDGSKDQEFARLTSFVPKATLTTLAILRLMMGREK